MQETSPEFIELNTEEQRKSFLFMELTKRLTDKWEELSIEKKVFFTQLGLIAAVQAVDFLSTYAGLHVSPGKVAERNPMMAAFVEKSNYALYGLIKASAAAVQIGSMVLLDKLMLDKLTRGRGSSKINNILRVYNACYTALSANNVARFLG